MLCWVMLCWVFAVLGVWCWVCRAVWWVCGVLGVCCVGCAVFNLLFAVARVEHADVLVVLVPDDLQICIMHKGQ